MQNSKIPFYTVGLNDLLNALANPDAWNKIVDMARKQGTMTDHPTNTPAKETPKEEEDMVEPSKETNDTTIGSVFDED